MKTTLLLTFTAFTLVAAEPPLPKTITCIPETIFHCTPQRCENIPFIDLDGTVQRFTIDPVHGTIVGNLGERDISAGHLVRNRGAVDAYVFFGTRPNTTYDWVLTIDKESGRMTASSVTYDSAFTLFGRCSWEGRP